jgi:hypothetical protein
MYEIPEIYREVCRKYNIADNTNIALTITFISPPSHTATLSHTPKESLVHTSTGI